ncbi:MAG: transcriptional regulator GutM [Rubrobacteraceae bacterium]
MGLLGTLILVLAMLWILQIVGTHFQMRHYRQVLGGITRAETEGYVGVGNAKASFGKGVLLILVVNPDGEVARALRMRGRTVFARFTEAPGLVGASLEELKDGDREDPYESATMLATARAVEQIERIMEEKKTEAVAVS